jgi:peptidoglycan/xylan/chitin deacetylase (PgdA/CDA1 family)
VSVRSVVLAYHAVSRAWDHALAVSPARLEANVRLLLRRGLRPVTFTEAVRLGPDAAAVAVTFDDAYRSIHRLALPVLRDLGVPATVFAPTAYIGTDRAMSWPGIDALFPPGQDGELLPMSWQDLTELADAGWEIGSHSSSHPRLTRLGDEELRRELEASRAEIEQRLDRPCPSLAYPYGDVDPRVIAAVGAAGYATGANGRPRDRRPQALRWPRIAVYGADASWRFGLKVSPAVRLAMGLVEPMRRFEA